MIFYLVLALSTLSCISAQKNNVCDNYIDYFFQYTSPNCRYNPDHVDMPLLVTQHNRELETYFAITDDGYNLTVYRLPNRNTSKVVFIQHPATGSCAIYVDKGENSLAYRLSREGYDVWLGNFRGSFYGRKHITMSPNEKQFWNFSFEEMGMFDIPAQIKLVQSVTGVEKIAFVGHSMAANAALIYASKYPDEAQRSISIFVLMAPSIYFKHLKSVVKYFVPFTDILYKLFDFFGIVEFFGHNNFTYALTSICRLPIGMQFCMYVFQFGAGFDDTFANPPIIPIMLTQTPAGLSLKTLVHFGQNAKSRRFARFDYGTQQNRLLYNSDTPPDYNFSNVKNCFYFISGTTDAMATIEDVQDLYNDLPSNSSRCGFHAIQGYNHFHFAYGKNMDTFVSQSVVNGLKIIY